jgi:hypothetical protein
VGAETSPQNKAPLLCAAVPCPPAPVALPSAHRKVASTVIFLHCKVKQLLNCVEKGLAGAQVLSAPRDEHSIDCLQVGCIGGVWRCGEGLSGGVAGEAQPHKDSGQSLRWAMLCFWAGGTHGKARSRADDASKPACKNLRTTAPQHCPPDNQPLSGAPSVHPTTVL